MGSKTTEPNPRYLTGRLGWAVVPHSQVVPNLRCLWGQVHRPQCCELLALVPRVTNPLQWTPHLCKACAILQGTVGSGPLGFPFQHPGSRDTWTVEAQPRERLFLDETTFLNPSASDAPTPVSPRALVVAERGHYCAQPGIYFF